MTRPNRQAFHREILLGILLFALALLAVAAKLHVIPTEGVSALDASVGQWFEAIRTPALTDFFLFITQFGGTYVVLTVALIVFVFFLIRMRTYALPFFAGVMGNALTVAIIKESIQRARPAPELAVYVENLFSFPSGHSAIAVAVYGFIAFALGRITQGKALKTFIYIVAVLFIALIGISRLYLGVHYLSDVIAGFLFGSIWLWIAILAHKHKMR